jgi:hypothetical protein
MIPHSKIKFLKKNTKPPLNKKGNNENEISPLYEAINERYER